MFMDGMVENRACIWKGCRKAQPTVLELKAINVQKISLGTSHIAILSGCGKLLMLGINDCGQLGIDVESLENSEEPVEPLPGHFFVDVACGKNHTCAATKDGNIICWGSNEDYQCGHEERSKSTPPHRVEIISGQEDSKSVKIVQVACGHSHTVALSCAGELWTWGSGPQLGLGKIFSTHRPMQIKSFSQKKVLSIKCGAHHSVALVSSEISQAEWPESEGEKKNGEDDVDREMLDRESEKDSLLKEKRMQRLSSSYSLSDAQISHHPLPIVSQSVSFGHNFELELQTCSNPVNQTIQETPEAPKHLLSKTRISELVLESEEETSFVELGSLNIVREVDLLQDGNVVHDVDLLLDGNNVHDFDLLRDGTAVQDVDLLQDGNAILDVDLLQDRNAIQDVDLLLDGTALQDVDLLQDGNSVHDVDLLQDGSAVQNVDLLNDGNNVQDSRSDCSLILLSEDDAVSSTQIPAEDLPSLSVEDLVDYSMKEFVTAHNVKRTLSLEEKQQQYSSSNTSSSRRSFSSTWNSFPGTCSSFLDEFKAKEFLQRQLDCVNPLVQDSLLPSYGSALQSRFESASSAVKMLASHDVDNPLSKKFGTLLQHVPSSPGVVQEYVSQLTRTVVSNIRTSVDKIVSTGPLEALTEGVSGGVMEVVKMAKRKSFGESAAVAGGDVSGSSNADLIHLCVQQGASNRSDVVSKSTSMNPIEVARQTHHRNVSLPTGTLESLSDILQHHSRTVCWDTEVWSWGQGSQGQLGLGDTLDRDTPVLMVFFSHEHIAQVAAGTSHNVALSHSGQVFVWGCNSTGQLGHQAIKSSSSPLLLEMQGGLPCWNVTAGDRHTLIACDGLDNSPQVFYCGYDPSCTEERLTVVKQLLSVSQLKSLGPVQEIFSGGNWNGCLLRHQSDIDDVVKNSVYELSCSERFFCLTLKRVISKFLQPLIQKLDVNECNGLVVGTAVVSSNSKNSGLAGNVHWGQSFRLLFSKLSYLQQLVARNQSELKQWLLVSSSNPRTMSLVRSPKKFISSYASYFKAYCDAVSSLCFDACIKNNKEFFDLVIEDFPKFLEDDKFVSTNPSVSLQNLTKLPYFRFRDYQKTLDKMASQFPAYSSIHAELHSAVQMWKRLRQSSDVDLAKAQATAAFWKSATPKLLEALQTVPSRRLVRDGKVFPITLLSGGGGARLFSWNSFVLFNDCFVQVQYSGQVVYPLPIIWVEISPDTKALKNAITLLMPEETLVLTTPTHSEKAEWVWSLQQTIKSSMSGSNDPNNSASGGPNCLSPPLERHATYTFNKSGWLKDATYTGQWKNAMMHGKGELKWTTGKKYVGNFMNGQMEGCGTMTCPKEDGMEVKDGTWKAGHLNGFGVIRYSNGDVYRGYFSEGKREGHGIMKQGKFTTTSASIYYGQWMADKRSGYGVFDDIPRGQKYMGQWQDDSRHGNGVVVTLDGHYIEGNFSNGKMTGKGLFLAEDNHFYEGDFFGFSFSGKGALTFPNGDCIEGSFGGNFTDGVKINGVLKKSPESRELKPLQSFYSLHSLPQSFGKMAYPAEQKWEELYHQCYSVIGCSKGKVEDDECSKVWCKIAAYMTVSAERKASAPCKTTTFSDDMNIVPDFCQESLTYSIWKNIATYLAKAFDHPNHPLGFLLSSLVDVYLATYVGVSAHVRLLIHAVLELKAYVENIYTLVRHLFPKLPVLSCILPISEELKEEKDEVLRTNRLKVTSAALLHPIIIPKVYSPLINLFVIHNERDDEKYWRRASLWNKQSDEALLTYLDVDRKYFLLDTESKRSSSAINTTDCYHEAIERLQRISTSFTPLEKMLQIHRSFREINLAVGKSLGKCPQWSMDELFPVFWFVVVRSRIQHLGAEIHFIEELMEKHLENGELGLMFTTLKACYFQILNEKMT